MARHARFATVAALAALNLAGCASAIVRPTSTSSTLPTPSVLPSASPSPTPHPPSDWPVVYTTANYGQQLDAVTWYGTPAGAINLPAGSDPFPMPSPDGRRILDWPRVISPEGTIIATIDIGSNLLRDVAWSASGDQLCIITSTSNQGPDGGALRIDTDTPGSPVHFVGTVSVFAGGPSIAACDPATNRIVILNVFHEHEGGGGAAFSAVLATWVFSVATGRVGYHASYPGTNSSLSATQVVASPTGRYLAVSRDEHTDVRDATSGQLLGTVAGSMPLGFSGDADASLLAVIAAHGNGPVVWVWSKEHVLWASSQAAQWSFPDPGVAEVLVGVVHANEGFNDMIAVTASGRTVTLGLNVTLLFPCPCPVGAGLAY